MNYCIMSKFIKEYNDDNIKELIERVKKIDRNEYKEYEDENIFINFYDKKLTSPWFPIESYGPWIYDINNNLIYEAGGYGMLGFGYNNKQINEILGKEYTMANIMTPNIIQYKFSREFNRVTNNRYNGIMALNSGSEINELAFRIADYYYKKSDNNKKTPVLVIMEGSFHGRTYLSAQASDNSKENYKKYLGTYELFLKNYKFIINDIDSVIKVYDEIEKNNEYPILTLIEPVMGEGNPGMAITPEFYRCIRNITNKNKTLLLIDSIQAGIRATGHLSIVTYPEFNLTDEELPDMETFSKAINGGQYPLSILAVKNRELHQTGIYGNTMTANPRGLNVGTYILSNINSEFINNIQKMGKYLLYKLDILKQNNPKIIERISGTGLLCAIHLYQKYDSIEIERYIRNKGLNVIHGGKNGIRLTPWFLINENEINLIIDIINEVFSNLDNIYELNYII